MGCTDSSLSHICVSASICHLQIVCMLMSSNDWRHCEHLCPLQLKVPIGCCIASAAHASCFTIKTVQCSLPPQLTCKSQSVYTRICSSVNSSKLKNLWLIEVFFLQHAVPWGKVLRQLSSCCSTVALLSSDVATRKLFQHC